MRHMHGTPSSYVKSDMRSAGTPHSARHDHANCRSGIMIAVMLMLPTHRRRNMYRRIAGHGTR